MESGIEFLAADNPNASKALHIAHTVRVPETPPWAPPTVNPRTGLSFWRMTRGLASPLEPNAALWYWG
jgi:hypothetical protein